MRKTEVFGIDIPELGDPSDITVVSDAIHDVENAMGCKIEFMNAVSTPGLISLNSKVRIHPYTTYYDDMVFAFIAPIDIPVGNSIAIKIDDLPQQPFNNETFNGKGSLVFITYNAKTGFKSYENGSKIINDLTTGGANDALSAEMGKQLQNSKLDKTDAWRIQPKELPSGTDLNNIKETGFYSSLYGSNIIHNTPSAIDGAFELTVTAIQKGNYTTQLLKDYRNSNYYTRKYDGFAEHTNYWTQWQKIALEDEVVKKSGDTMTGQLVIQKNDFPEIAFSADKHVGVVGYSANDRRMYLENQANGIKGLSIFDNGVVVLPASNLQTPQKEVIGAINNIHTEGLINRGEIRESPATADSLKLLDIGIYSVLNKHTIYELPSGYYELVKLTNPAWINQKIIVYPKGVSHFYWVGSFANNVWQGWEKYISSKWTKIGEAKTNGQTIGIGGYEEIVVYELFSPNTILDVKYFPLAASSGLRGEGRRSFRSYSTDEECYWEFVDGNYIKFLNSGPSSDGGIIVYGR